MLRIKLKNVDELKRRTVFAAGIDIGLTTFDADWLDLSKIPESFTPSAASWALISVKDASKSMQSSRNNLRT